MSYAPNGAAVIEVPINITVNQHSATIDGLVDRRKFLHMGMLANLRGEVERDLQPVDLLVKTVNRTLAPAPGGFGSAAATPAFEQPAAGAFVGRRSGCAVENDKVWTACRVP